MKWYQNQTATEKKNLGESSNGKRKKRVSSESHTSTSDDDEEGIQMHLKELLKESKKSMRDIEKIIRLQSHTSTFRLRKIEEFPSATRAQRAVEEYPFLEHTGNVCVNYQVLFDQSDYWNYYYQNLTYGSGEKINI